MTSNPQSEIRQDADLGSGTLSTKDIVFFVLAGVAPMGVVVGILSLSIALGNGPGVPGTYLIAGAVLALFAIGYVRMSQRVTSTGGFYTFAKEGLGTAASGATAYLAVIAYNAAAIGIFGSLAFFSGTVMSSVFGINLAWGWWALLWGAVVAILAYFEISASAKVLALALAAEVGILLVFNVAVLVDKGFHGFSLDVFRPSVVFADGFGWSLMAAFGSFVGFEAAALYGEEARSPRRSVPRAVLISLGIITVFYMVTMWATITAYGVSGVKAAAASAPDTFVFVAMAQYVSEGATKVMEVLVVTSMFAAFLAFHASTARYHYALAREGLLPQRLQYTHPRYGSPVAGSALQLGLVLVVTALFGLAGQHPYLGMGNSIFSLGVLGIVALQAIASASIVGYFLRNRRSESVWSAIVAPALGGIGLLVGLAFMISNYSIVAASTVSWLAYLPWSFPIIAAIGAAVAIARTRRSA